MCLKRKEEKVRLKKKETRKQKLQNWIDNNKVYLFIAGTIIVLFLLVYLCFAFMPGTESGLVYNNRTGVI